MPLSILQEKSNKVDTALGVELQAQGIYIFIALDKYCQIYPQGSMLFQFI